MTDPVIKWRKAGVLHFWRYKPEKSGLNGWHVQSDVQGRQSVIELLEHLCAAKHPAKRTLTLTKPSERIVNGPFSPLGGRKVVAPVSLQLSVDAENPDDLWDFEQSGDRLRLRLGRQSAMKLLNGFRDRKLRDYGDFCAGPTKGEKSQDIWFW